MKNFKKMMAFGILMGGLTASNSFAGTGIIISDAKAPDACSQSNVSGIIISDASGIIISDAVGVLMSDAIGVLMSDLVESDQCSVQTAGVIMSD